MLCKSFLWTKYIRQNAHYDMPVTHHFHPLFRIQDRLNGRVWKMKNKMFTFMVSLFPEFWHAVVTVFLQFYYDSHKSFWKCGYWKCFWKIYVYMYTYCIRRTLKKNNILLFTTDGKKYLCVVLSLLRNGTHAWRCKSVELYNSRTCGIVIQSMYVSYIDLV